MNWLPHPPNEGPPLPRGLTPYWPWHSSNHTPNPPATVGTNTELDNLEEEKKREWLARYPGRPGLVNMALRKAREEAYGLVRSPVYAPILTLAPDLESSVIREVYKQRLRYAELWIRSLSES